MLAVYRFRGPDQYDVVFGLAGKYRPKALDPKTGSGRTTHARKRVKMLLRGNRAVFPPD